MIAITFFKISFVFNYSGLVHQFSRESTVLSSIESDLYWPRSKDFVTFRQAFIDFDVTCFYFN